MEVDTSTKTNVKQAVPFFGVTDIEASVRFYTDRLGFNMGKQWIDEGKLKWCWLQLGDAAIMLQEFWKEGQHDNTPDGKLGQGVSICFFCEDALAIYQEVTEKGSRASRPFRR